MSKLQGENQVLTDLLMKAKSYVANKEWDQARDTADVGIASIATLKHGGIPGDSRVGDTTLNVWLDRFWNLLDNNNLML